MTGPVHPTPRTAPPERPEAALLREEIEALRLANAALEAQLQAGAEQAEAMFGQLERQRNALREAHGREQSLSAFSQRIMDTVGGIVIVLDAHGRLRQRNRHCQDDLAPVAEGGSIDALLHPDEREALASALPALPWPVHSALFETVRRQGQYLGEHRLRARDGRWRYFLIDAVMLFSPQGKEEGAVISGSDISLLKAQEQQLRASDARFNQAERVARAGSWDLALASGDMTWSAEMFRLLGVDPAAGASTAALLAAVHPDDRALVATMQADAMRQQRPCDFPFRIGRPDAPPRWVQMRSTTVFGDDGQPLRRVGTVQDITDRRLVEEKMRLAASVFDNSLNGILIADADGRIVQVNQAFTEITGYSADEAIGRTPSLMKSGQHGRDFYREMWATLATSSKWEGEVVNRRKDGTLVAVWESIAGVRGADGALEYYIGIFSDISEQKASAQRIHQLAYYDVLTGLPNRALLLDRCAHALTRASRDGTRLAMLFLDLDRFKHINDSLGHPVGDALLQAVAERLRNTLRGTDTIARLGGDEFVVLLEKVDSLAATEIAARRVVGAFREPFQLPGHSLSVGTTVGISLFPDHASDVTTLLKYADLALYQAKEAGRGDYRVFEAGLTQAADHRMRLESELRQALPRGELRLQYQPLYRLADGSLMGAEALLRWRHPEMGEVSPGVFIPVAEDSGLIASIGAWVLEQACRQARQWLDAGLPLGVIAVNVAGAQIERDDLVDQVATVLTRTGLPARCLELEISEAYLMRHPERDLRQLARLRELGVSLSLDDFGTGHSSLGTLRRMPVGKLKIDRAFMAGVDRDAGGATIARAIIGLGHSLGLTVVAEGVETVEQEAFLRAQGCDQVQGFRYHRPLEAAAFAASATRRWGEAGPPHG